jgi:methylated-DNA-[protein]-cysteine S-methyltransferase
MGVTRQRATHGASPREGAASGHGVDDPTGAAAPSPVRVERVRDDAGGTIYRYAVDGWGVGEVVVRNGVLAAHAFPSRHRRLSPRRGGPSGGARPPEVTVPADPSRECDAFVSELCRRFGEHLAGRVVSYEDVLLDDRGLTAFQRELLAAARSLCWGEVVTYGGLAALAARPRAARAAGSFCAANRWSLVVPCHRVVASGADEPYALGGYGSAGASLKRRLLALEGTVL